jgi:hypothetical protein
VLVKAQFLPANEAPTEDKGSFTTSAWCHNAPPVTSSSGVAQGCVCSPTTGPLPSLATQAPGFPGQTAPISEYTETTAVGGSTGSFTKSMRGGGASAVPCPKPTESQDALR